MITVKYLQEVLPELEEFRVSPDMVNRVRSGDGFDEVTAILENIRSIEFPCIVIEERSSGSFTIEAGPVDTYTIALWVMLQQTRTEENDNSELFGKAFDLLRRIIKILIRDQVQRPEVLAALDITRMPYNKRFGGPKCLGYELLLTFREDINLAYE